MLRLGTVLEKAMLLVPFLLRHLHNLPVSPQSTHGEGLWKIAQGAVVVADLLPPIKAEVVDQELQNKTIGGNVGKSQAIDW